MTDLQNTKAQLVYRVADNEYERVNPLTLADIVQMEESESSTAENIINYVNTLLADKADKSTTLAGYGITDAYTKLEVDTTFAAKSTTLAGYGITDAYTKLEVDGKIAELINFKVDVVPVLPPVGQQNVLYLVPKSDSDDSGTDVYDEYLWIIRNNVGHYEFIGTTAIDLSNYYTKEETNQLVSNVLPSQAGNAGKYLKTNGTTVSWEEVQGGSSASYDSSTETITL